MRNRASRSVRVASADSEETRGGYALQVIANLETDGAVRRRLLAVDPARFWLAAATERSARPELDLRAVLDRAETVPLARLEAEARARTERLNERLRLRRADDQHRDAAGITTMGANQ